MGTRLIQLAAVDPGLRLAAALERPDHPRQGEDAGLIAGIGALGIPLSTTLPEGVEVMIDFSIPAATLALAEVCRQRGTALVVATTGFEPEQRQRLERCSDRIALVIAPNLSRAVYLLMRLAGTAARMLGDSTDIEIIERHHHFKKDAPSGTALRLAEVMGEAIGSGRLVHGRHGLVGERPRGEIGIHALRTGDNTGEHTIVFGLLGETLELTHRSQNRDGYALGALDAAKLLAGRPPGLYTLDDLFGGSSSATVPKP
jgi:4-hydroxy-tetrahydrodipicolinate reductase